VVKTSGIDPYGSGEIEHIDLETNPPTIQYRVQLQPEIDLKDYRSVRVPYTPPEVTDEIFNQALSTLLEQNAVVEQSYRPLERGNRATFDYIHSFFVEESAGDDAPAVEAKDDEAEGHDDEHAHDHNHEHEEFIHEHTLPLVLNEEREPLPGFIDAVVGMNPGDVRTFDLVMPNETEKYGDDAGRTVRFEVKLAQIETITLPTLNDDFAARVTANREKPLTLLELRIDLRDSLTKATEERYRSEYLNLALDAIIAQADVRYPEDVVIEQINVFLNDLDERLRGQGLTLQEYLRLTNRKLEEVAESYRPAAVRAVKRGLVARRIGQQEGVVVSESSLNEQIDTIVARYEDEQQDTIRSLFAQSEMRESVANDLLMSKLYDRIIAIAKGDDLPPLAASQTAEADEQKGETP
jgi:trigger factor